MRINCFVDEVFHDNIIYSIRLYDIFITVRDITIGIVIKKKNVFEQNKFVDLHDIIVIYSIYIRRGIWKVV